MLSKDSAGVLIAILDKVQLAVGSPSFEQDAIRLAQARRELVEILEAKALDTKDADAS